MVKEVVWTDEAVSAFRIIIQYLESEWSKAEVIAFITATDRIIDYISERPRMFRKTGIRNVHEAMITPHNLLIYRIKGSSIQLITFWDTRRNPKRKKF